MRCYCVLVFGKNKYLCYFTNFYAKINLHTEVLVMGLKFQKDDFLERKLEEFVILPTDLKPKKETVDIERFLKPEDKENKKENDEK